MPRNGSVRRWPTVAAVAAVLIIALVGTAIAESGTATVSASKLTKKVNKALAKANRAVRISRNTRKKSGPQGPAGVQGPKGDAGAQGPAGVSGLVIVETSTVLNSANVKEESVECPSGKKVFGGGAAVEGPGFDSVAVDLTQPNGDTGWVAAAHEHDATASSWELQVYAICGNAS